MRAMWKASLTASFALAVMSVAAPAIAAECGALPLLTTLDMNIAETGVPIIPATIADKPVKLLVDTGGAFSMLTKRTVRELGLKTGQAGVEIRNIRGQASSEMIRLPSLTLGRLNPGSVAFMVDPAADNPNDTRPPFFHGVLAPDFLANVDVDFDFAANKLNIISQNHCAGKVVYWQAPTVAIVPMAIDQSGHITLRMELDGKRVNAMLDTGASNTNLNLNTARQMFNVDVNAPDVEKVGDLKGGYTASIYRRRFKSLAFEGVVINNPMIDLLPDMLSGQGAPAPRTGSIIRENRALPDVILGMTTLSQLHLYIAYKERKVYITAAGAPPASAPTPSPQ